MRFKIMFNYYAEGTQHNGIYYTEDPSEFIWPMKKQYGDNVHFRILGAEE